MIAVGCTGGIGSGKSRVVALLESRGAVAVRADDIARRLLEPCAPAYDAVVERFGAGVVAGDGALDRRALAERVFSDPSERAALESIVHPLVHEQILAALEAVRESDAIVVLELPLLVETDGRQRYRLDGVLVVDAPEDIAIERIVRSRNMTADEARRRIATQVPPAERLRAADFIIVNVGTEAELEAMAGQAWRWIEQLRDNSAD